MGAFEVHTQKTKAPVLVIGASGLQGSAVCRRLIEAGYAVRGFTRNPEGRRAQALSQLGVALYKGHLEMADEVRAAITGVHAVFAAFDPWAHGAEGEYRQAVTVIQAAQAASIQHFVYSSVGSPNAQNGVSHFESKWRIEQYLQASTLHWTILRPTSFMEGLTEKKFVPSVLWHVWGQVSGWDTPLHWVAIDDIARATVRVLNTPEPHRSKRYTLVGHVCTLAQARALFISVRGKAPLKLPVPVYLFRKWISEDLYRLFQWYRQTGFDADTKDLRSLVDEPLQMHSWLLGQRS